MEFLTHLWLPILVSAVVVWIASNIVWMAMPHHKKDFIAVPDEDGFIEIMKKLNLPPGNYEFPDFKTNAKLKDPKVQALLDHGPVGHLSLWPTPVGMWGTLVLTFLVYLVAGILLAYLGWQTLPHGTPSLGSPAAGIPGPATFSKVFQVIGTAGILTYCFSFIPNSLWFGTKRSAIIMSIIDGVAFGLITGAIFAWLWPR